MNDHLEFLDFSPENAHYFEDINSQWIKEMFVLEDIDRAVLQHPEKYIINRGGKIWFAKNSTLGIVGTCALLNKGNGYYELTKMGVYSKARGLKVGEKLLRHVLKEVKQLPVKTLFLLTNAKCEAAIHLYEKNGFVHDDKIMQQFGKSYDRCNVAMHYFKAVS